MAETLLVSGKKASQATKFRQQFPREFDGAFAGNPGSQKDGEEFGVGQGVGPRWRSFSRGRSS
jgi:hypothetical protein